MNDETFDKLIKRIEKLERELETLKNPSLPFQPYIEPYIEQPNGQIYIYEEPYILGEPACTDNQQHIFPEIWNSTGNAPCQRCGYTPPQIGIQFWNNNIIEVQS